MDDEQQTPQGMVVAPRDGVGLRNGANQITVKIGAPRSERFSIAEFRVAPGFVAPPVLHHHTVEDWAAYVVAGEITFLLAQKEVQAAAGTTVFFPAGADFAWRNDRDDPAVFLAIYAPAGFERFFTDVDDALSARGAAPTPETMREIIPPLWATYGIEPRG